MEMFPNVRLTDGRTDVFGYSSGGEGDKQQRNQFKHQAATERALASPRENGSTTFHNYRPKYPQKIVHAISSALATFGIDGIALHWAFDIFRK